MLFHVTFQEFFLWSVLSLVFTVALNCPSEKKIKNQFLYPVQTR